MKNTLINHLEFASPVSGLGSKMGLDAINKWPGETSREWGRPLTMSAEVTAKVALLWQTPACDGLDHADHLSSRALPSME